MVLADESTLGIVAKIVVEYRINARHVLPPATYLYLEPK
jgi:hypothetical protein